jgi:hypothetical protein
MIGAGFLLKAFREVQNDKTPLDLTVRLASHSRAVCWPERTAQTRFQEELYLSRKVRKHRA